MYLTSVLFKVVDPFERFRHFLFFIPCKLCSIIRKYMYTWRVLRLFILHLTEIPCCATICIFGHYLFLWPQRVPSLCFNLCNYWLWKTRVYITQCSYELIFWIIYWPFSLPCKFVWTFRNENGFFKREQNWEHTSNLLHLQPKNNKRLRLMMIKMSNITLSLLAPFIIKKRLKINFSDNVITFRVIIIIIFSLFRMIIP